jgi:hypothetical protein
MGWLLQRAWMAGTRPTYPRGFDRERGWIFGMPWRLTSRPEQRLARASGTPNMGEELEKNEYRS